MNKEFIKSKKLKNNIFLISIFLYLLPTFLISTPDKDSHDEPVEVENINPHEHKLALSKQTPVSSKISLRNSSPAKPIELLQPWLAKAKQSIKKFTLPNKLTVLYYHLPTTNEVFVGCTYNMGSKNEKPGFYGAAHMIEHMIFKGTDSMTETDLKAIAEKYYLGGIGESYNANTTEDLTTYYFITDKKNWPLFLSILADCMHNVRFSEEHFSSEVKTVVSEIQMYHADPVSRLFDHAYPTLFPPQHPYHHPLAGHKEDLLKLTAQDLKKFYQQYYTPSNAVLIIVGNLDPDFVGKTIEEHFSQYVTQEEQKQALKQFDQEVRELPLHEELVQTTKKFYSNRPKPQVVFAWALPGLKTTSSECAQATAYILGERLRKLEDDQDLVFSASADISSSLYGGIFIVSFSPKDNPMAGLEHETTNFEKCKVMIEEEILKLMHSGPKKDELDNFKSSSRASFLRSFESCLAIASLLNSSFFIHENEYEVFDNLERCEELTRQDIQAFCNEFLRPSFTHTLASIPFPEKEKPYWLAIQERVEEYNKKILKQKERTSSLEDPKLVKSIPEPKLLDFEFNEPDETFQLSNGLTVHAKKRESTPFVVVSLNAKNAEEFEIFSAQKKLTGIPERAMNLLIEGNADFTKKDHIDFFHSLGAECWYTFDSSGFSCLNTDFDKVADRFVSILTKPGYPEHVLKQDIRTSVDLIKKSEKNPNAVARLALQLYLFKDYPWTITNEEKIARLEKITQKAIFDFHKTYIIPQNFVLVVVGNYDEETLHTQLETAFSNWTSTEPVPNLSKALLPDIKNPEPKQIKRELHEEQVLIVGQRVTTVADHPEDLALRLLETHLERKLFDVRDQTGICYVLAGNLIQGGHFKSKGAASIVALVAIDKVDQAIEAIKNTLQDMSEHGVTEEYLKTAKDTYLMRVAKSFSTNASYASMYGFLLSHNKSWDYLQQKTKRLQELPIEDVNNTAKKYLDPREWTFITVGRI